MPYTVQTVPLWSQPIHTSSLPAFSGRIIGGILNPCLLLEFKGKGRGRLGSPWNGLLLLLFVCLFDLFSAFWPPNPNSSTARRRSELEWGQPGAKESHDLSLNPSKRNVRNCQQQKLQLWKDDYVEISAFAIKWKSLILIIHVVDKLANILHDH